MGGGLRLLHIGGVGFLGVIAGPAAQGNIDMSAVSHVHEVIVQAFASEGVAVCPYDQQEPRPSSGTCKPSKSLKHLMQAQAGTLMDCRLLLRSLRAKWSDWWAGGGGVGGDDPSLSLKPSSVNNFDSH